MLFLLIRSENILKTHWKIVCELCLPVLPLLLCMSHSTSKLGLLISKLIDPDSDSSLPTVTIIKGNAILLFSHDKHLQDEAMLRLTYMLQKMDEEALYLPSINHITDCIPPNLCIVEPKTRKSLDDFENLYERESLQPLLNILLDQNPIEPSVRHTALAQINFMLMDGKCINIFYRHDGIPIVMNILKKSIQVNTFENYANNAILVISILCKVCIQIPSARRQLANDPETYVLILRSLILFQYDDNLKRDGSVLLFMLAFNEFIIGGAITGDIIVPPICRKLFLPIECEYSWHSTNKSVFNVLLQNNKPYRMKTLDCNSNHSFNGSENAVVNVPQCWQFIRVNFAALWFGSLDNVLTNCIKVKNKVQLNYKLNPNSLAFDEKLEILVNDVNSIEGTSPQSGIQFWLMGIRNATSSNQVTTSLAAIESFSNADSSSYRSKQWDCQMLLDAVKRFSTTPPNNKQDEEIFIVLYRLIGNFIERHSLEILIWVLNEFNKEKCLFINLLTKLKTSAETFVCNVQFIETVIATTIRAPNKKHFEQLIYWPSKKINDKSKRSLPKIEQPSNLYEKIFELVISLLDKTLTEKRFGNSKNFFFFSFLIH